MARRVRSRHGHVRYFGDHKPSTIGLPGTTRGNGWLLEAARLHQATTREQRLDAPPLLLFRAVTVHRDGRAVVKGHVEFCGAAIIERVSHVGQRDPQTGRSFPNVTVDLAVIRNGEDDEIDLRWVDDRRDATLSAEQALRHAPAAWKKWTRQGRQAIPGVRRRVLTSPVRKAADQQPPTGSSAATVLSDIHTRMDRGLRHHRLVLRTGPGRDHRRPVPGCPRRRWDADGDRSEDGGR